MLGDLQRSASLRMYFKESIGNEQFYWDKQIERHHIGKRIRKLARKIKYKPYKQLAKKLEINRRTVWALANGLTTASRKILDKIESLEHEN
jgi:ribosome-binding protein aMBF1 (putative translation factor)